MLKEVKMMKLHWPAQIEEKIFLLGTHHFNSYLILGERYALIEAGVSCSAPYIIKQFEELGLDPQRLAYIMVMHAHPDHVTGVPSLLEAFPRARVVGSALAKKILSKEKAVRSFYDEDFALTAALVARGEVTRPPARPAGNTIPIHLTVKEGDELELGNGVCLKVLETPGHSLCSISVFCQPASALFISDAGGFQSSPDCIFPCFFSGYQLYLESLQRLEQLKARILAPAHDAILTEEGQIHKFFQSTTKVTKELKQYINDQLMFGQDTSEIIDRLVQHYYRDNLSIYSRQNIQGCVAALVKMAREENCSD
jgi:glyoxylase-like metal-dependent hydrolase (beta-lactamase superfamily II)